MAKKRIAEDTPEQVLTAKANKKRRVSDGNGVAAQADGPSTASAVPASPEAKKKEKKDKKDKKDKKKSKEVIAEPEDTANASAAEESGPDPVTIASPAKKSKGKNKGDAPTVGSKSVGNAAANAAALQNRREQKAKRRRDREQELASQVAKAKKDVDRKGNTDREAIARLSNLRKLHKKAKKDLERSTNHSSKRNASQVDVEALRREVREQVFQELKQEDPRKQKFKDKRKKKKLNATKANPSNHAEVQDDEARDVDETIVSEADEEAEETLASDAEIKSNDLSRGLVPQPRLREGSKPTSDSLQVAQLDHSLASIDLSRFSQSLQAKIKQLQALEWSVSRPAGGRILDIEPIFSPDQESIIIAYPTCVRVFSTKTTLLLRTLEIAEGHVVDIALHSDPKALLIAASSDSIEHWDWLSGERRSTFELDSTTHALFVSSPSSKDPKDQSDIVYTVQEITNSELEHFQIQMHDLSSDVADSTPKVILRTVERIVDAKAFDGGKLIVAAAGKRLIAGIRQDSDASNFMSVEYLWHELDCPDSINCIDTYALHESSDAHVAVGTSAGPIYLYRNLISQLQSIAKRKATTRPMVQRLHWHRFAVETVKFSKDGNYLVSGGFETVLCKWQLDTGKREDLPHMTAPIESLVISPDGASYAVRLGNNSLIILSTLDFQPTFATAGPALPADFDADDRKQSLKAYPAALRTQSMPLQLLLATPSSSSSGSSPSAVFLQTLDARSGVQMEKQALTRTNITDRVSDPQGRVIEEPDVMHIATTLDGKWLASVEDWRPPVTDLEFTADDGELHATSTSRRETYLKFWSRNEDTKTWQLSSRIDNPHGNGPHRTDKILDLMPEASGFVTISGEGHIKVWRQQNRQHNGVTIKDKKGTTLTAWHCVRTLPAPAPPVVDDVTDTLKAAKLALSADKTLLLAVLKYRRSTVVRLIDHVDGSVKLSRSDIPVNVLIGAAIVDRYLVILAESLIVWDIVQDRLHFSYRVRSPSFVPKVFTACAHLAAHETGMFAIAVPTDNGNDSEIIIFDPASPEPLAIRELPNRVRALLPVFGSQDFVVVDEVAQVKHLQSPQSSISSLLALAAADAVQQEAPALEKRSALQLFELPSRSMDELSEDADKTKQRSVSRNAVTKSQTGNPFTQESLAQVFEKRDTTMGNFFKIAALAMRGRAAA